MSFFIGGYMKGLTHEESKQLKARIVEYRKQGHYIKECCEHFGVKESYVSYACKGIDYPWLHDTATMSKAAKRQAEERREKNKTPIAYVEKYAPWAEYVGGYTGCDGRMLIRCRVCGKVLDKSVTGIRHGEVRCQYCYEQEKKRFQTAKAKEDAIKAERKRVEALKRIKFNQLFFSVCQSCGNLYLGSRNKIYCSEKCCARVSNQYKRDKRLRKIRTTKRDKGITLQKLYIKHNGICALCGNLCDWDDYLIDDCGAFVALDNYPSVDHIIPISKGGAHTWNNVQLACRRCNNRKRDKIVPFIRKF